MKKRFPLLIRLLPAIILLQTLFFKFSGAEESVYIFETIGAEPWGRYATGILEFIVTILLFVPRMTWLGAIIGLGLMGGAIMSHFTTLGIEILGDGGLTFGMGWVVFICLLITLWLYRHQIPFINLTKKS